jgi:putative SOS response-associated peptidase YedK
MQTREVEALRERFRIREARADGFEPRSNIAPSVPVAVVRASREEGKGRILELYRWGLVPSWTRSLKDAARPFNARAETLVKSPMFRGLLKSKRCLVPADGFFEWTGPKGSRRPVKFALKSGRLFAFAGLWDVWRDPAGAELCTCTIVTCPANALVEPIHDRMPVILREGDEERWLQPTAEGAPAPLELLRPYEPGEMALDEAPAELGPRQLSLAALAPPARSG